jgi:MFS family permease
LEEQGLKARYIAGFETASLLPHSTVSPGNVPRMRTKLAAITRGEAGMEQVEQPTQEYAYSKKQITWAMVAIFAVYGVMAYFVQSLNIARPKMAAALDGMALYSWSVSIPSLISAFVTLLFGKFSDIYGRRIMLTVSLVFCLIGTILSALSTTFVFLIVATCVSSVGTGAMMPLVFAVVGDVFPPSQRGKWIGLLNIPTGIFSLIGPTMGGWFVDNLSWRYLYWMSLPLLVVCLIAVPIGVPSIIQRGVKAKIDYVGCLLVAIASTTAILGLSYAGVTYPWASMQIIGLLGISLVFWVLFFRTEIRVKEPILDPLVFRNRSFLTVAIATLLSFFGQMGMMMYFPMFLQGIQGISATRSGQIITPYSVIMSFVGVPVGFALAKYKRYKWMYILGFGLLTLDMFGVIFFTAATPVSLSILAAVIAGLGLGAVPTVNTMVVQNAVPKRLLGAAMGAIFFCILMGVAISPAVLGSAMNSTYNTTLARSLPNGLREAVDESMMVSIGNPRVLLQESAMKDLETRFNKMGSDKQALFQETVQAIRTSFQAGLKSVFWVSAITMLLAFLLICTIPEISLDSDLKE